MNVGVSQATPNIDRTNSVMFEEFDDIGVRGAHPNLCARWDRSGVANLPAIGHDACDPRPPCDASRPNCRPGCTQLADLTPMPWTLAHPAAVLPLRRLADAGYFSFPALLVGCITPDVVYHVGRWDLGRLTHTPVGVLLLDVPIGALLLWCCCALRVPVARLLPEPHRSVLIRVRFMEARWGAALITLLSLALGAATHVLWDSFTHATAFFVHAFEWLASPVPFPGPEIRVYTLLQHGGSLLGATTIAIAYHRHCLRITGINPWHSRIAGLGRLAAMLGLANTLALPIAWFESISATGEVNLHKLLVRQIAYSTSAFVGLVVVVAIIRHCERSDAIHQRRLASRRSRSST